MEQAVAALLTSFIVASAIFVALGWYYIRRGKRQTHQRLMAIASIFATIFFILYLTKTYVIGSTQFGGPDDVKIAYLIFLVFHIVLSTVGGALGLITLWQAYKRQYEKHKKIGPWASVVWFATAITGVMVYLLLYVIYPPGEPTSLFEYWS